jgi:hypothetical protein
MLLPAVAAALACALAAPAHASILQPGNILQPNGDLNSDLVGGDSSWGALAGMAADGMADAAQAPKTPNGSDNQPDDPIDPAIGSPISSGNSSSSSSPVGSGPSGSPAFIGGATFALDGHTLSTRLSMGQCLWLPAPPGVELLRPPRAAV